MAKKITPGTTVNSFFFKYRLTGLAILSGILFSLSWPARGIPFIIFIAFIPLFIVEDHVLKNKETHNRYAVLLYSWLGFALFNAFTTWWIVFASVPGVLLAVFLNSFFMAIPFYLMHLARRILPGKQGVLSLLIFWLSFEYLHLDWDLSWSWLNLGNVFAAMPRWIQWYEFTGTLGGTAWIILANIGLFSLYRVYQTPLQTIAISRTLDTPEKAKVENYLKNIEQFQLAKKRFILGIINFFLLLSPPLISLFIWNKFTLPDDPVEVVIVQPGRDPYKDAENLTQARQWTDSIILLADEKLTSETRFVITPEGSLPAALWLNEPEAHYGYSELKKHAMQFDSLAWVAGVMMYRRYGAMDTPSPTARKFSNADLYYDVYNASLYVNSKGETDQYFKSKLVPGIEQMPFGRFLGPVGKLVEHFGGTAGSMGIQEERSVFVHPDGTRIAPVICYESIYGAYVNQYVRNGAELIFISTNDGWWRNTPGYKQHFQYARLRAIETRRYIARAALTGISGFIDSRGNVISKTEWWTTDSRNQVIHKNNIATFYVKHGDYLGRLSLFLLVLLLLYMITQKVIKKKV